MISLRRAVALVRSVMSRAQAVPGLPLLAGALLCAAVLVAPRTPAAAQTVTLTSLTPSTLTTASPTGGGTVTLTITGSGFNANGCSAMGTPAGAPSGTTYACSYLELRNIPQGPSVKQIYIAPSTSTSTVLSTQAVGTVTATQITATLSDTWFQHAGLLTLSVQIFGGTSQAATLPLTINSPAPVLTSVSPTSQRAGTTSSLSLYVSGSNFTKDSVVLWNGVNLGGTQTATSSTQLLATIPPGSLTNPGNVAVAVSTPDPNNTGGGGTSAATTFQIINPYPSPTALAPISAPVGSPGFSLSITGLDFVPGATVQFGNSTYTPSAVTPTAITVSIPASEPKLASSGAVGVSVTNPGPGGGTGSALTFMVVSPQPSVSSVSPASAPLNGPSIAITVTGQNFDPSAVVTWNGTALPTVYLTSTRLTAAVPAAAFTTLGAATIGVTNVAFGTASTTSAAFAVQNPVPGVSTLAPAVATGGGTPPLVTITGSNFVDNSTVLWNGQVKTPTGVSATQLQVALSASDLAQSGSFQVLVSNPAPGGGTSAPLTFTVTNPQPTLSALSLTSAPSGSPTTSVTVTGANFVPGSQVTWNGATVSTTYGSGTQLTATIPAASFATPATASIGVRNPAPGGGTSNTLPFTVVPPAAIQVGALQQSGTAVAVPVDWTGGTPDSGTFRCGQAPPTTISTLTGTCTYTAPGTYAVSGSYVLAGRTYTATPASVTIPALAPQPLAPVPTVNGQPATGTIQVYSTPATLVVSLPFAPPSGVGLPDPLDLSRTRLTVTVGSEQQVLSLRATEALDYSASTTLTTPGTYTLSLTGVTQTSGQAVTESATFTLAIGAVTLQTDPAVQVGRTVIVGVHWPSTPVVTNQSVNCGTSPTQTFPGPDGSCTYTTGGLVTVGGTFTDPSGTPNVATAPSAVTIPWLPLQPDPLAPTINGQPGPAVQVYSLPATLTVPITWTVGSGVGILDALDLSRSTLAVSVNGQAATTLRLTAADALHYSASTSLSAAGTYVLTLHGLTQSGQAVTTTATFTLAVSALSLQTDPPVQTGTTVTVGVHWPASPVVTNPTVDCGTTPAQIVPGTDGQCLYSTPGTFPIVGQFTDPRIAHTVSTAAASAVIPALVPQPTLLVPAIGGQPAFTAHVHSLPVPVDLPLTFTLPAGVGILDELDLTASHVDVSWNGATPKQLTLTRIDGLRYETGASLTDTANYTFTLVGKTKTGQPVTVTATLALTITPVSLQAGTLAQQGSAVAVPIQWPTDPAGTNLVVECGTTPVQTFTGASGQCVYTAPGTFTVTGRFTEPGGTPNIRTAPLAVSIPSLELTPIPLVPTIGGQPAASLAVYALPVPVTIPVRFTAAPGVGIPDSLNLGASRVAVLKDGVQQARLPLQATDRLDYRVNTSVRTAGTYTFTLDGHTQAGRAVTVTATLPLTFTPVLLQAGALAQQGPAVAVPIVWPSVPGLADQTVNCGVRSPVQTFIGPSGQCVYRQAGTFLVTGQFTDPNGNPNVATAPLTVIIPSVPPAVADFGLAVNGEPAANTTDATTLPAVLGITVTLAPAQAVGIRDPIVPVSAGVTVTLPTVKPIAVPLTASADGLTLTGQTVLEHAGTYHAAFAARTQRNVPVTAAADLTISGAPLTLQVGALHQESLQSIAVPVAFPANLPGSNFSINCGSPRTQVLSGTSVVCTYTAPGAYTPVGSYVPAGTTVRVPTLPAPLTIPGLLPAYLNLAISFPDSGIASDTALSAPSARVVHLLPTAFPINLAIAATPVTDPGAGIGIPDLFDPASASMTLQLVRTNAGQAVDPSTHTVTLPLFYDPTANTFRVRSRMPGFDPGTGTPNVTGQWRLSFQGTTTRGTPVTTGASVHIDDPPLQAVVIPSGVQGPYAPAQYRYQVTAIHTAVKHERIGLTWTVTDSTGTILRRTKNATTFVVNLKDPGRYHVSLSVAGSVSGSYRWSDDLLVPQAPADPSTPVIQFTSGGPQRPPVQVQLKTTSLPPLDPGDRYTSLDWFLDGVPLQHPANRATITQAGPHTIQVTAHALKGDDRTASVSLNVRGNMSPRGTLDCTRSVPAPTNALLSCTGTGLDPDGRIINRQWVVPELNVDVRGGWLLKQTVKNPPPLVTVHFYVTDDSGDTQDLGPATVPLQPTEAAPTGP